ncbi:MULTISPECIES: hypothetical protein [unclassified Paenibacillus]|uniref:hypothetical protein n=1 Tax=unclassified Paenibacillus TaxID=185978 RepID=UPI00240566D6|nr:MULTISPECIES: hypothetical protein [unclassified Paenibacillus]MDF9845320.1 hypothetical protein [Paenibacillus sp. PastF-2]MDF9851902.1 hypothetical protein [Paenibacillus sp. PastM-2]MDF9858484.1 hypothetical protein [Paenibacillus sp. PastF-1]
MHTHQKIELGGKSRKEKMGRQEILLIFIMEVSMSNSDVIILDSGMKSEFINRELTLGGYYALFLVL